MATTKTKEDAKRLEDALNVIRMQATENAKEQVRIAKLAEQALSLARGTNDVSAEAFAARAAIAAEETIPQRIRAAILERGPMSIVDLSKVLAEPAARVQRASKILRASRQLRNVGTDMTPMWWWASGDKGETTELREHVEKLLRHKPLTLNEIVEATGARRNRISGVLVKLQVRGVPVKNLGTGQRAVWYVPARKR